ncbi:DUF2892 domain-containing protein [uncultured Campylobacter sp.]|uniref:YgaP family membrane protein n=1 Tax=uncultured Campylobacter sp. TaxID=218934 RepID=UPI0026371E56|nr:DUF2892 domain-containing protein [uncultured Campylobacter sp.]
MSRNKRILRVLLGVVWIAVFYFAFHSWFALVGLLPIAVGISGFCPACYFLNRCSIKK